MHSNSLGQESYALEVMIGTEFFYFPSSRVIEVFRPVSITPIFLAPPQVVGLCYHQGRIVTLLSNLFSVRDKNLHSGQHYYAVSFQHGSDLYALLVDDVGDLVTPQSKTFEYINLEELIIDSTR